MKKILLSIVAVLLIIIGYYQLWFLRLPERNIPLSKNHFISPANGQISAVVRWDSSILLIPKYNRILNIWTSDIGKSGWMISIEMDITNVHYQRMPIYGKHLKSEYVEGKFKNALIHNNEFGLRLENEHNSMLFEMESGDRFKIIQVAGLVARRIVDMTEARKTYQQGDIIGLIKLGSQVSLILTDDVTPTVAKGDYVVDGVSIVAKIKNK